MLIYCRFWRKVFIKLFWPSLSSRITRLWDRVLKDEGHLSNYLISSLCCRTVLLKYKVHTNYLAILIKWRFWFNWSRKAWESPLLTGSQVMPMLLFHRHTLSNKDLMNDSSLHILSLIWNFLNYGLLDDKGLKTVLSTLKWKIHHLIICLIKTTIKQNNN